jgi:hypothetical protein
MEQETERRVQIVMRVLFAGCLIALSLAGQGRFETLQHALALSDQQIAQLQQVKPWPPNEATRLRGAILDDAQRTKLTSIRKVLYGDMAHLAARLGLINQKDWERRFGGTCLFYEIHEYASYTRPSDLSLSTAQAERFEQIQRERDSPAWAESRAKGMQREALVNSGSPKDSPEVVALGLEINQLQARMHDPLPRDTVMSILDSDQKAKFAEFEIQLEVASQAVQLGLIEYMGEVLCH